MTSTTMPTLYKKTHTGAIQYWDVKVVEANQSDPVGIIAIAYGQLGTSSPQIVEDVVTQGKNVGKKNARTPYEQAVAEAKSRWEKQIKKGYVEDLAQAEAGENELPAYDPMLAKKYEDRKDKLEWPVLGQPKLDGMRCLAVINKDGAKLYTRTRLPIKNLTHIEQALVERFVHLYGDDSECTALFDGELYTHEFKDDFNAIISRIKRDEPHDDNEKVQYWIYDTVEEGTYEQRSGEIMSFIGGETYGPLVRVPSFAIESPGETENALERMLGEGYEGLMLRTYDGEYEHKRSSNLLKFKVFIEEEFEILGMTEGSTNRRGTAGTFVCKLPDGRDFEATPSGSHSLRKKYWDNQASYVGKKATVRYFRLTPDGKPRFGVMKAVRDYE